MALFTALSLCLVCYSTDIKYAGASIFLANRRDDWHSDEIEYRPPEILEGERGRGDFFQRNAIIAFEVIGKLRRLYPSKFRFVTYVSRARLPRN